MEEKTVGSNTRSCLRLDEKRRASNDDIKKASFIRDFFNAYTWKEMWIVIGACVSIYLTWVYLCVTFWVPYPFGAIMAWSIIAVLSVLCAVYNPKGRAG